MKKLLLGLLAFGMMACHQVKEGTLDIVKIDVNSSDYLKDEAVFKDFDFVKLDTISEALLSDVSKVLVGENRLYVLPVMDPRVFIFTKEGKYVNSLRMGQGPGEVRCVYDMKYHDGNIYAFDNFRTIRKYDKDGKYIEDVYTRNNFNLLMEFEQDQLLLFEPYMSPGQEQLMTVVTKDTILSHFPKHKGNESPFFFNLFYSDGHISWPMCDTIYHYDAEKLMPAPKYVVQFNHLNVYDAMKNETITPERWNEIVSDEHYCKWIHAVRVHDSQLFFGFKYDKPYYVKHSADGTKIYSTLIKGLPDLKTGAKGIDGKRMIYSFNMEDLMEYKEEMNEIPEGKLRNLYEQVTDVEDNPILVFVTLE